MALQERNRLNCDVRAQVSHECLKGQGQGRNDVPGFQQLFFFSVFAYTHGYHHGNYFTNVVTDAQRGFPGSQAFGGLELEPSSYL